MRFLVGDLVTEKTLNHWYFTTYGYGFSMSPEYYPDGYWDDYYENAKNKKPRIGIIIDIKDHAGYEFYGDDANHKTYKVMWLNLGADDYMMDRYFFGDELRLLSKIYQGKDEDE